MMSFVFPMCCKTTLGYFIHSACSDLNFDPAPIGAHNGAVQCFIAIGFRGIDPVAESIGSGTVYVRNQGVNLVTLFLFVAAIFFWGKYQANGKKVVDLLKSYAFFLHFLPDTVNRFWPS